MLLVLSPAKSLDFETPPHIKTSTQPQFIPQSSALMKLLSEYDVPQLSQLMHISDKLAALNVARNSEWKAKLEETNGKQATLAIESDA